MVYEMPRKKKDKGLPSHFSTRGKRLLTVREALEKKSIDPVVELIKIANKAQKEGDLNLASKIYIELNGFQHAKLKPFDPIERTEKLTRDLTLGEIQRMRERILDSEVGKMTEEQTTVIDVEPEDVDASDLI